MVRTGGNIKTWIIVLFLVFSLSAKTKNSSIFTYSQNPVTYLVGANITPDTPSTFGTFSSYSISPTPQLFLFFDTTTGILWGKAGASMPTTVYTIVANNGIISDTTKLTITVYNPPPTNFTYPNNPVTYPLGALINPNLPTFNGFVDSCSISPPLPQGLVFGQISQGSISGTPTVGASTPTTIYTVVVSNESGSDTTKLSITIPVVIPTNLTYSTNPAIYVVNTPITANTPSSQGSAIASYSISPKPPMFLKYDTTTGILSGTPATSISPTLFTVIATNFAGSDTTKLSITIIPIAPPIKLSYNSDTLNFIVGTSQAYTPFVQGGTVASYSISPPLSDSLTFDTLTGIISGTPPRVTTSTTYTISAINAGGTDTTKVLIKINPAPKLISAVGSINNANESVLLSFDRAVNIFAVSSQNINTIFRPSSGHSWLSSSGTLGSTFWGPDSTMLLINLSPTASSPTIAIGDTIFFTQGQGSTILTGNLFVGVHNYQTQKLPKFSINAGKNQIVFIIRPDLVSNSRIKIQNLSGKLIASFQCSQRTIWNCKAYSAGIFIARIYLKDNLAASVPVILNP